MWWRSVEESHAPLTTPRNASAKPRSAHSHSAPRIRTPVDLRCIRRHIRDVYRKTRIHRTRKRRTPFSRIPTRVKPFFQETIQRNFPGTAVTDVLFFFKLQTSVRKFTFLDSKPRQNRSNPATVYQDFRNIERDRLPPETSIRTTSHHPISGQNSPSRVAKASLTFIRRT